MYIQRHGFICIHTTPWTATRDCLLWIPDNIMGTRARSCARSGHCIANPLLNSPCCLPQGDERLKPSPSRRPSIYRSSQVTCDLSMPARTSLQHCNRMLTGIASKQQAYLLTPSGICEDLCSQHIAAIIRASKRISCHRQISPPLLCIRCNGMHHGI